MMGMSLMLILLEVIELRIIVILRLSEAWFVDIHLWTLETLHLIIWFLLVFKEFSIIEILVGLRMIMIIEGILIFVHTLFAIVFVKVIATFLETILFEILVPVGIIVSILVFIVIILLSLKLVLIIVLISLLITTSSITIHLASLIEKLAILIRIIFKVLWKLLCFKNIHILDFLL